MKNGISLKQMTSRYAWCILQLLCCLGCTTLLLSSCYQPEEEKEETVTDCQWTLSVVAPIGLNKYPAYLLIFDTEGQPQSHLTLSEQHPRRSISLPYGTYHIVALSGTQGYIIPRTLTLQSVIQMSTDVLPNAPLLMGQADVTLGAPTASTHLQLKSQAAAVSVLVDSLSAETERVRVSLAPCYTTIDLESNYAAADEIPITLQPDGDQWQSPTYYLFPSPPSSLRLHLEVERTDSSAHYDFDFTESLRTTKEYLFKFTMAGNEPHCEMITDDLLLPDLTGDTLTLSTFPTVAPCLWEGHVLAHFTRTDADEGDFLLLSLNEWAEVPSANNAAYPTEAQHIASQYTEGDDLSNMLSGWTIPTKEEAQQLRSLYAGNATYALNELFDELDLPGVATTTAKGAAIRYLCDDGEHTFSFAPEASTISKAGTKATYHLRLVKHLHVKRKR